MWHRIIKIAWVQKVNSPRVDIDGVGRVVKLSQFQPIPSSKTLNSFREEIADLHSSHVCRHDQQDVNVSHVV